MGPIALALLLSTPAVCVDRWWDDEARDRAIGHVAPVLVSVVVGTAGGAAAGVASMLAFGGVLPSAVSFLGAEAIVIGGVTVAMLLLDGWRTGRYLPASIVALAAAGTAGGAVLGMVAGSAVTIGLIVALRLASDVWPPPQIVIPGALLIGTGTLVGGVAGGLAATTCYELSDE